MSLSDQDNTRIPLKAALWEEAKGKLRALVAVQGSYTRDEERRDGDLTERRWRDVEAAVERFIVQIEDNGLHE